jgi:uncharacterized protein (DUF488 family)
MIFTIGHSTLSAEDFTKALDGKIDTIIDVRSHPTSRWPQFRKEEMEKWLPQAGVNYAWEPRLGGWDVRHEPMIEPMKAFNVDVSAYMGRKFPKHHIAIGVEPPSNQLTLPLIKPAWTNTGLRDHSYFEMMDEFLEGVDWLVDRGNNKNVAILCCEAMYFKCHRSMISDTLAFLDVESHHIVPHMRQKNKIKYCVGHKLIAHSKVLGNRLDRYDDVIIQKWRSRYDEA